MNDPFSEWMGEEDPGRPSAPGWPQIEAIAPNLKRRLSGVTATIARIVPAQAGSIAIVATGPGLPPDVPHVPLWRVAFAPRDRWRVWHARRNVEMLAGLILKHLFARRFRLVFTSASQRRHTAWTRWLVRRMDAVIATSRKTASYLERPATVILHGIDTGTFAPARDRAALRRRLGLPDSAVIVGCFGRIRAQKGTGDFVAAMRPVLAARPDTVAVVMGRVTEGYRAYLDGLRDEVRASRLEGRLLFLPEVRVSEMPRWYAALDLFVAPQRWEGFGLTPLEAMASGVPVVATRVGAFDEIVADGETGVLISPADPPEMTRAVSGLLADPSRLAAMGVAARAYVASRHTLAAEAAAITAVYRHLLDTAPEGGR